MDCSPSLLIFQPMFSPVMLVINWLMRVDFPANASPITRMFFAFVALEMVAMKFAYAASLFLICRLRSG